MDQQHDAYDEEDEEEDPNEVLQPTRAILGSTWLEGVDQIVRTRKSNIWGRQARVRTPKGKLRRCQCGIPDTPTTIPARLRYKGRWVYGWIDASEGEFHIWWRRPEGEMYDSSTLTDEERAHIFRMPVDRRMELMVDDAGTPLLHHPVYSPEGNMELLVLISQYTRQHMPPPHGLQPGEVPKLNVYTYPLAADLYAEGKYKLGKWEKGRKPPKFYLEALGVKPEDMEGT